MCFCFTRSDKTTSEKNKSIRKIGPYTCTKKQVYVEKIETHLRTRQGILGKKQVYISKLLVYVGFTIHILVETNIDFNKTVIDLRIYEEWGQWKGHLSPVDGFLLSPGDKGGKRDWTSENVSPRTFDSTLSPVSTLLPEDPVLEEEII